MGTDVLFAIPGNLVQVYQSMAVGHHTEPPAKARFMASYLIRRGIGVDLIDATITGDSPKGVAEKVRDANPALVVIPVYGFNPSSSTHTMPAARALAVAIKQLCPTTPILMSGTHPAALPEKTLRDEPIDFVCAGEGPITVHELLQAIQAGGALADIRKVRSLWYWDSGAVVHNAAAPLIDLNIEPSSPAAWALMDPRRYQADDWHTFYVPPEQRMGYANPYSREGCPFSCGFCNIQAPFREGESLLGRDSNSFRELSPALFVAELEHLVGTYGIRFFKIPDEMFGLGRHALEIAKAVKERFGDELNFWCYYRVDTCQPAHLDALRAAGIRWLGLGIEAANSTVRSGQDKGFTDEKVHAVVARVVAAGLNVGLNYIFGLPGDTMETIEATYDLACELNSPFVNFYCNQCLPGSTQYAEAKAAGYPLPERIGGPGWIGHSQYAPESEPFYMGDALKPAQILAFRDWAQASYFDRPEWISMIRTRPGFGEVAARTMAEKVERVRALKRDLFGGRTFVELSREEKGMLVPRSVK
ncbi:MAG: cobalamin-dependent protein [bacterium]|nr:cobalamin-dependent protein [bacterium]